MFYYLYEIRNNLNNKIYVGAHKTKNIDDGYMGSGKVIRSAIEKYGIENFSKVILEMFEDEASMYSRESQVVTDEFLSRDDVYNLRRGGHGGFDHINKSGINHKFTKDDSIKGGNTLYELKLGWHSEEVKNRAKEAQKNAQTGYFDPEVRKRANLLSQAEEAKRKRKDTLRKIEHQKGEKNSNYGKRWIYSLELKTSKQIKKEDPLPAGWNEGRKMKF